MKGRQHVLLVEDNDDDAELTVRALKKARMASPIVRVKDGVEALDYLFGRAGYAGRDTTDMPAVVLLDLNLPHLDGTQVLEAIRADPRFTYLPVVMLAASNADKDRLAAYHRRANSYVCKPVMYNDFFAACEELGVYWLALNQPPPRTCA